MNSRANQTTATFRTESGQNIFYRNWKNNGQPKGVVLIVHGLNSHSGYYHHFALRLNENNFEVFALDLRGRGHSEGERYYIADYREIVTDINQLLNIAKKELPTLPIFLLGHSAGGVFASVYAIRYQGELKGLISESFAFQIPAPGFALAAIKWLSHIIPHKRLVKLNNEDFSREISIVDAMNNDPLLLREKQPAKTMQQLLFASEFLKKHMPDLQLPLLILHGTSDKATKPGGSEYFMKHASSTDKQLKLYQGYFHDLLNEKNNEIIVSDVLSWLNDRTWFR